MTHSPDRRREAIARARAEIDAAYIARDVALAAGNHKEASEKHFEFHRLVYGHWPLIRENLSAPVFKASQNTAEGLPSSDAARAGADAILSSDLGEGMGIRKDVNDEPIT